MDSLVKAVQEKRLILARNMLKNGADADSASQADKCLLYFAIRNHDKDMVKLLLEFNANPNYIEPNSKISILQFALLECFDEVIEMLIENGADINYVTFYGLTSLHLALERKDEKVVLRLLQLGADPNVKQPQILPLISAGLEFNRAVAGIQLSRGFSANGAAVYVTPGIFIEQRNKLKTRKAQSILYYNGGTGHMWTGPTALQFSASLRRPDLVNLLLDYGASVDQQHDGDLECVNPLFAALLNSDDDTACLLIERGADVNSRNKKGRTPLHLAAYHGCPKAAEGLIVNRGVLVDVEDCEKITPLHMAVERSQQDVVDFLISHGANVNACSHAKQYTSLHHAVVNDNRKIALRLLEAGASVMIAPPATPEPPPFGTPWQRTALEVAVHRGRDVGLIKILLKHVLERESQVDRREAFARLVSVNKWPLLADLIVMFLARLDEGIEHDFFARTNIECMEGFYNKCVEELNDMKTFVVYKKLSLHDIFARRGWQNVSLMRNKILIDVLEKCDYLARYPIYENLLKEHLNEAKTLRERHLRLQNPEETNLMQYYRSAQFPYITEKILDYLGKDKIDELHRLLCEDKKN